MTQPIRPGQRPGQRPTTIGDQGKPPAAAPTAPEPPKAGAEHTPAAQLPPYGPGLSGQRTEGADQSAGGMPGSVPPKDVFQLAVWAVTPPYSEEEAAERRAQVREILQELVDAVTSDRQENQNTATYPTP